MESPNEIASEATAYVARTIEGLANDIRRFRPPGDTHAEREAARKMRAMIFDYLCEIAAKAQRVADGG